MPVFGHEVSTRFGGDATTYRTSSTTSPVDRYIKSTLRDEAPVAPKTVDDSAYNNLGSYTYNTSPSYDPDIISNIMTSSTSSDHDHGGGDGDVVIPNADKLAALRQKRLDAAIAAIAADFATRTGDLEAQIKAAEALYPKLLLENEQATELAQENVENRMSERGLFFSGLHANQLSRALQPLSQQRAQIEGDYNPRGGGDGEGTIIRDLMSQIELLVQQQAAQEAAAKVEAEYDELDLETLIAMTKAGLA